MGRVLLTDPVISAWGVCVECECEIFVKVTRDNPDGFLPPESEWNSFGLTCPVCGETVRDGWDEMELYDEEDEKEK